MPRRQLSLLVLLLLLQFAARAENPVVDIYTNYGRIGVQLYPEHAPKTCENFLKYVDSGRYDGAIFHRVIENFMIQGGGFYSNLSPVASYGAVENESNNRLSNQRGTIAMARTSDPHSASSQFFINVVNNLYLDYGASSSAWGYTVFGSVVDGIEVADAISKAQTTTLANGMQDVPAQTVYIGDARRRAAQLAFVDLKPSYAAGDSLSISLQESGITRTARLDLWVAVSLPDGSFQYFTPNNGLSPTPQPLAEQVDPSQTRHGVFQFTVPSGLAGRYGLYAIFNQAGSDLGELWRTTQSNIAYTGLTLTD